MYSFVDNLIFPAPASSYSHTSFAGKIVYIPKFLDFNRVEQNWKQERV